MWLEVQRIFSRLISGMCFTTHQNKFNWLGDEKSNYYSRTRLHLENGVSHASLTESLILHLLKVLFVENTQGFQ